MSFRTEGKVKQPDTNPKKLYNYNINTSVHEDAAIISLTSSHVANSRSISTSSSATSLRVPSGRTSKSILQKMLKRRIICKWLLSLKRTQAEITGKRFCLLLWKVACVRNWKCYKPMYGNWLGTLNIIYYWF